MREGRIVASGAVADLIGSAPTLEAAYLGVEGPSPLAAEVARSRAGRAG
jgi:hypothetical protein